MKSRNRSSAGSMISGTAVTRLLEAGIPLSGSGEHHGMAAATAIRMSKRYEHIGNRALCAAADVLGGVKTPAVSLKKSPKSPEVENGFIQ